MEERIVVGDPIEWTFADNVLAAAALIIALTALGSVGVSQKDTPSLDSIREPTPTETPTYSLQNR